MNETKQIQGKKFTPPVTSAVILLESTRTDNMLVETFLCEDKEVIGKLIKLGENINTKNQFGHTALHMACLKEDVGRIKLLIENGADVNFKDGRGNSALMLAVKKMNLDLVEEIMKHKPDLTIQNNQGENALKIATELYKDFSDFIEESKTLTKIIKILKV
jgi:ankyrin repeat protein